MEEEYTWPLDADGIEIKPGDKIYFKGCADGETLKCVSVGRQPLPVEFIDWEETGTSAYEDGAVFTHRRPKSNAVRVGSVATFEGVKPDKAQALKVLEEAAEVFGAWQDWDRGMDCKPIARIAVLDEIADVVQAACNLVAAFDVTDFAPYMQDCRIRNEERGRYGNTGVE